MMQGLQSEHPRHVKLHHTHAKTALLFRIADFLSCSLPCLTLNFQFTQYRAFFPRR